MASVQRATRHVPDHIKSSGIIRLRNVPVTATPADLRRFVIRGEVQGVEDVSVVYARLRPKGTAILRIAHPDFFPNLDKLEKVSITGVHPLVDAVPRLPLSNASQDEGLSSILGYNGRDVALRGLPSNVQLEVVEEFLLRGFSLPQDEPYIFRLRLKNSWVPTASSVIRVRLASVSEAHRLVRKVHMTTFQPNIKEQETTFPPSVQPAKEHIYLLRAHVLY